MTPRHLLPIVVAAATAAAFTPLAVAQPSYYWQNPGISATYVYRYSTTVPPCGVTTFETRNLSTGADTVMHVMNDSTATEWAYNDDYDGLGSRIVFNRLCKGTSVPVTVWVLAKSNITGGTGGKTFEFFHNDVSQGVHRLGGYIFASGGNRTEPSDTMESILVNNGAPATLLILFHWNGSRYVLIRANQTGGVGNASRLPGSDHTTERWVIATPTEPTREGRVRLARNDRATADSDGDGLGDMLEYEACTCRNTTSYTCPFAQGFLNCNIPNPQDTDGDGLTDRWELLGLDNEFDPLPFPLWGANPRHKDMFIELDQEEPDIPAMTEAQLSAAAAVFSGLTNVSNPDGNPGITLHFDRGAPCTQEAGDVDGITNLCGDFGGVTRNVPRVWIDQAGGKWTNPPCNWDHVLHTKRGKFRWVWRSRGHGTGSAPLGYHYVFMHANTSETRVLPHELGHTVGLQHYGVSSAGEANTKPNYPSIMNYAYGSLMRFSTGSLSSTPLDPRNLSEQSNFGGSGDLTPMLNTATPPVPG
jgi:hypothetical protein